MNGDIYRLMDVGEGIDAGDFVDLGADGRLLKATSMRPQGIGRATESGWCTMYRSRGSTPVVVKIERGFWHGSAG